MSHFPECCVSLSLHEFFLNLPCVLLNKETSVALTGHNGASRPHGIVLPFHFKFPFYLWNWINKRKGNAGEALRFAGTVNNKLLNQVHLIYLSDLVGSEDLILFILLVCFVLFNRTEASVFRNRFKQKFSKFN
ncbi:hypothetical protein CDAR_472441 [Caerostris darwini]|uniref:Uncharacterized protein n=1 Tax=Caerostris darwini TaxID=1538125 RepID=A0AAV4S5V4_9ARAC|nr:hypothetical protein CDAR_472441 [Caerostris darwini]